MAPATQVEVARAAQAVAVAVAVVEVAVLVVGSTPAYAATAWLNDVPRALTC